MTLIRAGLTEAQLRAFNFIAHFIEQNGTPPTVSEIAAAMNLASKSGVVRIVNGLVERGYVTRLPNRARSLAIVPGRESDAPELGALRETTRVRLMAYCHGSGEPVSTVLDDAVSLFLDQRVEDVTRDCSAVAEGLPSLHEAFK